ncbi:MAG TPA: hypothetical protein VFT45_04460, partial [Longimicrobium sp.]|nr:hypothetical protein [Longimicrobium sp.]
QEAFIEDEHGNVTEGNFREYGTFVFARGIEAATKRVETFAAEALTAVPAPASIVKEVQVSDFAMDPAFGHACKYIIAWDGVLSQLLSESAFFSIAHLRESEADLECSVELASKMYYKHAVLVLRGFIENIVLPIGFTDNREAFTRWREGRYHTPPLRGKSGLLTTLVSKGLIPAALADEAGDLYGDFNEYVHGSESRLIHGGQRGAYRGHVFLPDQMEIWAGYLTRSVDLAIRLMALHTAHWQGVRPRTGFFFFCDVCHEEKDFTTEISTFASKRDLKYTCNVCGSVTFQREPR